MKIVVTGVAAAGLLFGVVGCSSEKTVGKDDLATEVSNQLTEQVGKKPDSVSCPDDLKGEVGATTRCELKGDGETYGVGVKVTKVDGDDVKFDIKVDDQPQGGAKSSSASPTEAAPAEQDYAALLIPATEIVAPGDTFTAQEPTVNPGGSPGVATVFSNQGDTREIGDTIMVLPDAASASAAAQGAVDAFGANVVGTPEPADIGDGGAVATGLSPDGAKAVTLLVFSQGRAFVTLQFDSGAEDPVPQEFVEDVARKQDALIQSGLS
jgi:hypothetical protein